MPSMEARAPSRRLSITSSSAMWKWKICGRNWSNMIRETTSWHLLPRNPEIERDSGMVHGHAYSLLHASRN